MSMPIPEDGPTPSPRRFDRLRRAFGWDDPLPIDPDLDVDDPGEPTRTHRPSAVRVHRRDPAVLCAIAVGGFLGALARYGVALSFPAAAGGFPLTTFAINASGAFTIGVVLTVILERLPPNPVLRPLLCVGFLGAWTTVSTFATESAVLIKDGFLLTALAYMGATLIAGVSATALGIAIGRCRR